METRTLEKKIAKLPDSLKLKVEGYIDALLSEGGSKAALSATPKKINEDFEPHPVFGSGKGIFGNMSDDFDEPLDEMKDYM